MNSFEDKFDGLDSGFRAAYLIGGFLRQSLSETEMDELDAWLVSDDQHQQLFEELTADERVVEYLKWIAQRDTEMRLLELKSMVNFRRERYRIFPWWVKMTAAAVVGLVIFYFFQIHTGRTTGEIAVGRVQLISPGKSNAELTLPSGKILDLDSLSLFKNNGILIANGIANFLSPQDKGVASLAVPEKGFFKLVMSDGTNVWLNSKTSIRFPAVFDHGERKVFLEGEAYFEVAKDADHPFVVSVADKEVVALGTHFNVFSYGDESTFRTTLLEGSILVRDSIKSTLVRPGEEVTIQNSSWDVHPVKDLESTTAWVHHKFRFVDTPMEELLRQISRWYGVAFKNETKSELHFTGTINQFVPLDTLLRYLETIGSVHFKINNNIIIVTN